MATITFVYPDFESLGVEYLMAACLKDAHEVNFVFYQAEDVFVGVKKRNVAFSDIAKRVADTNPHIAAFSCLTDNYQTQLNCAKAVKDIAPRIVTVFGGVHPTAVPEIVLKEKAVDCVAIGEAEESFPEFLKSCSFRESCILPGRPVKGIVFKQKEEFIGDFKEGELPDLDTLPFPHKKPFYPHLYSRIRSFAPDYTVMTSRGCPYHCSYCHNSYLRAMRGAPVVRQRKIENVIAEILQARRDYSPGYITFVDDCFTADSAWLTEFCARYKKEIGLPFACLTIPQYLNPEKVKALAAAGCYHAQIGVQSTSAELCDGVLRRTHDNARTAEAIKMLRGAGIVVQADHMLGIPGDTLEIEEESALFYNRSRPHVISVFWLTYYPKTAIVDIARERGALSASDIENINNGRALTDRSFHTGGSMTDPRPYFGIRFLLHYIPLLPGWLVRFLIRRKLYRHFAIENYFFSTALPRFLLAIAHRKNFVDRKYITQYLNKLFSDIGLEKLRKGER